MSRATVGAFTWAMRSANCVSPAVQRKPSASNSSLIDRDLHPVQRSPQLATCERRVGARLRPRRVQVDHRVQVRIEALDALQVVLQQLARADLPVA